MSTSQLDTEFDATTIQSNGKSISFVPNERQEQLLSLVFDSMSAENVIAEATLNSDGLYQVKMARDTTRVLTVSVFPRIAVNNLSQAVFLLHASLSHMPQHAMVRMARSALEDTDPLVKNWPSAITGDVIQRYFLPCKACLMAQQKKLPFLSQRK